MNACPLIDWHHQVLSTVIPGSPVAASRPRVTAYGAHYPKKHRAWEKAAVQLLSNAYRGETVCTMARVEIVAVHPRPKSWVPRREGGSLSLSSEREWSELVGTHGVYGRMPASHERKDIDNVCKLVMDSLTKAHVLLDDRKVVELDARKVWTALVDDRPCVEVRVWRR